MEFMLPFIFYGLVLFRPLRYYLLVIDGTDIQQLMNRIRELKRHITILFVTIAHLVSFVY